MTTQSILWTFQAVNRVRQSLRHPAPNNRPIWIARVNRTAAWTARLCPARRPSLIWLISKRCPLTKSRPKQSKRRVHPFQRQTVRHHRHRPPSSSWMNQSRQCHRRPLQFRTLCSSNSNSINSRKPCPGSPRLSSESLNSS